ncbi:lipase family protein [Bacillus tuaregi]|uniref:hydrolase n=1 Tax=Bacillus tuaregi TaxID=1816695 RepID=UPI0008F860DD|nr:hydrolase [Bacillus tuaregi]
MEIRNFQLDAEWNIIHYPERPLGFGILIIGDERNFVDEQTSYWLQNEGKHNLLTSLQSAGYTLFYSNLYGRNWGSGRAVKLARRLYDHMMRSEILNDKIHIIAEGMGALVALKLLKELDGCIRSVILINPILSLKQHLELEKDRKFFYKKVLRELSRSYEYDTETLLEVLAQVDAPPPSTTHHIPMKIIHILSDSRAYKQSYLLNQLSVQWEEEKVPISVCYMVPEKRPQMDHQIIHFLKSYEKIL